MNGSNLQAFIAECKVNVLPKFRQFTKYLQYLFDILYCEDFAQIIKNHAQENGMVPKNDVFTVFNTNTRGTRHAASLAQSRVWRPQTCSE